MGIHIVLFKPGFNQDIDERAGAITIHRPICPDDMPTGAIPDGYEPIGTHVRGAIRFESTSPHDSEYIDGVRFDRSKLKEIRAVWPSVKFDVLRYGHLADQQSGAAFGVVDGWLVAMLGGCMP